MYFRTILILAAAAFSAMGSGASLSQTLGVVVKRVNCLNHLVDQGNNTSKCSINCAKDEAAIGSRVTFVLNGEEATLPDVGLRPVDSRRDGVDIVVDTINIPDYSKLLVLVFCTKR